MSKTHSSVNSLFTPGNPASLGGRDCLPCMIKLLCLVINLALRLHDSTSARFFLGGWSDAWTPSLTSSSSPDSPSASSSDPRALEGKKRLSRRHAPERGLARAKKGLAKRRCKMRRSFFQFFAKFHDWPTFYSPFTQQSRPLSVHAILSGGTKLPGCGRGRCAWQVFPARHSRPRHSSRDVPAVPPPRTRVPRPSIFTAFLCAARLRSSARTRPRAAAWLRRPRASLDTGG